MRSWVPPKPITAEELYEAWREEPSLHWGEIISPVNISPPGAVNEMPIFVRRWNRVAERARELCIGLVKDTEFPDDLEHANGWESEMTRDVIEAAIRQPHEETPNG